MRHLRAVVAMAAAWAAAGPEVTHADRDEVGGWGRGSGPSPTDWADAATVLGVNTHNAFPMTERELDLLQSAGFRWIRTDVMWASIEQQRGVYTFTHPSYNIDAFFKQLAARNIGWIVRPPPPPPT
eukprot:COSAG04_NODE_4468_length_2070_cov_3.061780_1_plen_125_part_10